MQQVGSFEQDIAGIKSRNSFSGYFYNQVSAIFWLNKIISFLQNVYLLAKKKLYVPEAEEIIQSGLAMYGGLCYDINPFFNFLLNALGYTSHLIGGQYTASPMTNCHVGVVVKGLDPDVPFGILFLISLKRLSYVQMIHFK